MSSARSAEALSLACGFLAAGLAFVAAASALRLPELREFARVARARRGAQGPPADRT